jgi:hypothetical protein
MGDDVDLTGGLLPGMDMFLAEPPEFEWIREGTSFWLYDDAGAFGIPRIGVEGEGWARGGCRYKANLAFADGRVLSAAGVGDMRSPLDERGRPSRLGAGPLTFECLEPYKRWLVRFEGEAVDTSVQAQIAGRTDEGPRIPLRYEIELTNVVPPFIQDVSPASFAQMPRGARRDALAVGLGTRFEQMVRGQGEMSVDGERRSFEVSGMRVKRRNVRTDGLFLRGHAWQSAVFPDGRAFGYLVYPRHDDGADPWNHAFVYQDGRMHLGRAVKAAWMMQALPDGDDVGFEIETELGVTRIEGRTALNTFHLSFSDLFNMNLHQGGARYVWDGQAAYGMIERSTPRLGKPLSV